MESEKERLLAVATPEEWDCVINHAADYHALLNRHMLPKIPDRYNEIAKAYSNLFGGFTGTTPGYALVESAIARLTRAGIWED